MKVLFATSEAYPFAVSGGLGDVAYALPKALRQRLIGCRVVMPLYEQVPAELKEKMKFITHISVPVSWRRQYCGIFEAKYGGVIYYLLDNQYYFKRANLYGDFDDAERFAFLSRAVLEIIPYIDFKPDIIHCNDWQTALIPVYYKLFYQNAEGYENIKNIFTIHNIQYQGKYGMEILEDVFGIPHSAGSLVEYDNCVNLMKGAIECANRITTVSPTYANEILDPWYSYSLDGILRERDYKLSGILNGIDADLYNPKTDNNLAQNYDSGTSELKRINKKALQEELRIPAEENVPLIGMVTRLVGHKGLELVKYIFEELMSKNLQFVLLGSGDAVYEEFFDLMAFKYPDKFAFRKGFIPELAHKIYGGADIFLMPSKNEPCGLAQMVALRYGTIPIVRETGGLKDTIKDSGGEDGNGFTFKSYNAHDMEDAADRAIALYNKKDEWNSLVKHAMECDNSWGNSANQYIKLYRGLKRE